MTTKYYHYCGDDCWSTDHSYEEQHTLLTDELRDQPGWEYRGKDPNMELPADTDMIWNCQADVYQPKLTWDRDESVLVIWTEGDRMDDEFVDEVRAGLNVLREVGIEFPDRFPKSIEIEIDQYSDGDVSYAVWDDIRLYIGHIDSEAHPGMWLLLEQACRA